MRTTPRVFVESELGAGAIASLNQNQAHYLVSVLRLKIGDEVLLFNGIDGEWKCLIDEIAKKSCTLKCHEQARAQTKPMPLSLYFAPIKGQRTDYIIEKATELGVTNIVPIITERTIVRKINNEKLRLTAIEAAEQCERLSVPLIADAISFDGFLVNTKANETILFADERGNCPNPIEIELTNENDIALLIGPEGGFTAKERDKALQNQNIIPISLGKQILRADTACFAGLSLIQVKRGSW